MLLSEWVLVDADAANPPSRPFRIGMRKLHKGLLAPDEWFSIMARMHFPREGKAQQMRPRDA